MHRIWIKAGGHVMGVYIQAFCGDKEVGPQFQWNLRGYDDFVSTLAILFGRTTYVFDTWKKKSQTNADFLMQIRPEDDVAEYFLMFLCDNGSVRMGASVSKLVLAQSALREDNEERIEEALKAAIALNPHAEPFAGEADVARFRSLRAKLLEVIETATVTDDRYVRVY
jgi:hypothetical protein